MTCNKLMNVKHSIKIENVVILRNSQEIYTKQEIHPNIHIVNQVGMERSTVR